MKNKSFSFPGKPGLRTVRIHGFGACMIAGVPHSGDESFFHLALQQLSTETGLGIDSQLTSLQGFPTHKAARHVMRALKGAPELLVIQLGSTDLTVDLQGALRARAGGPKPGSASLSDSASVSSSTPKPSPAMGAFRTDVLRKAIQRVKLVLCSVLRVAPIHGDETVYLPAIDSVLDAALQADVQPVLLAPFPHGDLVSDAWARKYTRLLEALAAKKGILFVDTYHGLLGIAKEDLLLSDKLHLSMLGHRKVAELLARALARSGFLHP